MSGNYSNIERKCFRCGRTTHLEKNCYESFYTSGEIIDDTCYRCGRHGHWSNICTYSTYSNGKSIDSPCIIL